MSNRYESQREAQRQERKLLVGFGHKSIVPQVGPKPEPEVLRRLIREIPEDTRDITSRIFGDPIPGRRAIDRRQSA